MPQPADMCEWEWDGINWNLLSGRSGCTPPPKPRDPPGTRYTSMCDIEEVLPSSGTGAQFDSDD